MPSPVQRALDSLKVYADRRMAVLFLLGFSSGLPRLLVYSTLTFWLLESGITIGTVGAFAATSTPYNLKFLWAPLIDTLRLPLLHRVLGRRRSWILVTQLGIAASLAALAFCDPAQNLALAAALAIAVAFFSASQDIVIDAYRVELLPDEDQGAGVAAAVFGYRIAMLVAGAGALYASVFLASWSLTYLCMAGLMLVGVATNLLSREPMTSAQVDAAHASEPLALRLKKATVEPLRDMTTRPAWVAVLTFVLLYKLGEALAGTMLNPFLLETGFDKLEIANIAKTYGLVASLAGIAAGGWLVRTLGVVRALWVGGTLQVASNLVFILQARIGHSLPALVGTIGIENITGGLGTAAFVAFLSALCKRDFTATQYALLTALSGLASTLLSSSAGHIAKALGWEPYFLLTTFAGMPALALIWWLGPRLTPAQSLRT